MHCVRVYPRCTVNPLRIEVLNLLFFAVVVRFLACLRTPCFVENYKKYEYDISPSAREIHEIRYLDITG